jgi:hypothetical protein
MEFGIVSGTFSEPSRGGFGTRNFTSVGTVNPLAHFQVDTRHKMPRDMLGRYENGYGCRNRLAVSQCPCASNSRTSPRLIANGQNEACSMIYHCKNTQKSVSTREAITALVGHSLHQE